MRDAPPDRKEAGDAPTGPRNPWVVWPVCTTLVSALYVLSTGPVIWLFERHYLPEEVTTIYLPLALLPNGVECFIWRYIEWWNT